MQNFKLEISKRLNKSRFVDELHKLEEDVLTRIENKRLPYTIMLEADSIPLDLAPHPGTVLIFYGRKNHKVFEDLRNAYDTKNLKKLKEIGNHIVKNLEKRKVKSIKYAVKTLMNSSSYLTVRYKNKDLAKYLGLTKDIDMGGIALPYNGGKIDINDFNVSEYFRKGKFEELDIFIVVRPPKLSKLEKDVLDAVPASMTDINIGSSLRANTVVLILVILILTAAGLTCRAMRTGLSEIKLSKKFVKENGSISSAKELLRLRRKVFDKHGL